MKTHRRLYLSLFVLALLAASLAAAALAVTAPTVLAQVQSTVMDWWVTASGGGTAQAGPVAINATLGQPITGPANGGNISLSAGFWVEGAPPVPKTNFNLFVPVLYK